MQPTTTRGAQYNFQKPENWNDEEQGASCGDLQVRKQMSGPQGRIECVSAWKPSVEDLALLNRGGVVELAICALDQPVVGMCVVEPVGGILESDQASLDRAITINEHAHGDDSHGA